MNIQLYYAPTTCALVPYVNLTEAGADFKVELVNMRKKQQMTPEYMTINPKHKVPSLVVDGKPLTENVAINAWIAQAFPQASLMPADPWGYAKALSILSWCSGGIHPHLARINGPAKFGGAGEAGEASVRKAAVEMVLENFAVADVMLAGRAFFFDHYTAPDAHFFWCFRRAHEFKLDLARYANCQAHFDRMLARDSVKKVYAFESDVKARFAKAA